MHDFPIVKELVAVWVFVMNPKESGVAAHSYGATAEETEKEKECCFTPYRISFFDSFVAGVL